MEKPFGPYTKLVKVLEDMQNVKMASIKDKVATKKAGKTFKHIRIIKERMAG